MSVATGSVHSNLTTPRSPVSTSTDSSRRDSLRQGLPAERLPSPPSPPPTESPRTRLSRKRAASLNTDTANDARLGGLVLHSAKSTGPSQSDPLREKVCLCQPDPKIPRPRNAFILYRQHYQAQVVSQHPGLANPEISKIIGEQWKQQAPEVKEDWKSLAEEEKQRHQRQYPGYRYQPRRAGKPTGLRPVSASQEEDPGRCPKCNGRYISTPNTPLTPFTPVFGAAPQANRPLPPFTPSHTTEAERPHYPAAMQSSRMQIDTPRSAHPAHRRSQQPLPQHLQTHLEHAEDVDLLSPSGQKRRRYNEESYRSYSANSPVPYSAPPQYSRPPMSAGGYRQPMSGPGMIVRAPQQGIMGPPPQQSPIHQHPRQQHATRGSAFDESLRLAPIQTQMPNSAHPSFAHPDTVHRLPSDSKMDLREVQMRSVEAMIMSIPHINKTKILSKISPPLAPPNPDSPAQEVRGSVVAVEGTDRELITSIGTFIKEALSSECAVKTWNTHITPDHTPVASPEDTKMKDAPPTTPTASTSAKLQIMTIKNDTPVKHDNDPFVDYFSIIQDWHKKSQEMINHITIKPSTPPPSETDSSPPKKLPIALIPSGFSLTISDAFCLRIPINDAYSPVDHWQWMATLWRGIVGPDLTIYVMRVGVGEMQKFGGVEIRSDCAAIVVRVPVGEKIDEKTRRRLGFEVLEFVRSNEGGVGFGKA